MGMVCRDLFQKTRRTSYAEWYAEAMPETYAGGMPTRIKSYAGHSPPKSYAGHLCRTYARTYAERNVTFRRFLRVPLLLYFETLSYIYIYMCCVFFINNKHKQKTHTHKHFMC